MRILVPLCLIALLAGCSDAPEPSKSAIRHAEMKRRAIVKMKEAPTSKTYTLAEGQLTVMEVPVLDIDGYLDSQRCFIWRDTELRSATLSCPHPPEMDMNP